MKPRVLVIDDDPGVRRILRDILAADGYEVLLSADGATALETAAQGELNAALLDYSLPDMDGLAVLRGLLGAKPNLPVVMVTGHASYELAVGAMKLGAFNFVSKPVDDESLLAIVRNAVERDSLQRR
ncbi:MAG: response regulator, partial [bacterium]